MPDTYTGCLNVVREIPEEDIPFETILVGLAVVGGIVYFVFMK